MKPSVKITVCTLDGEVLEQVVLTQCDNDTRKLTELEVARLAVERLGMVWEVE